MTLVEAISAPMLLPTIIGPGIDTWPKLVQLKTFLRNFPNNFLPRRVQSQMPTAMSHHMKKACLQEEEMKPWHWEQGQGSRAQREIWQQVCHQIRQRLSPGPRPFSLSVLLSFCLSWFRFYLSRTGQDLSQLQLKEVWFNISWRRWCQRWVLKEEEKDNILKRIKEHNRIWWLIKKTNWKTGRNQLKDATTLQNHLWSLIVGYYTISRTHKFLFA